MGRVSGNDTAVLFLEPGRHLELAGGWDRSCGKPVEYRVAGCVLVVTSC